MISTSSFPKALVSGKKAKQVPKGKLTKPKKKGK